MGITSSTQFVGSGAKPAAQSYKPCDIFGDPDVLGLGVRVSFYVLYITGVLVLLLARPDALKPVRMALSAIAAAVFVNLCVNSTGGKSLVIVDWWVGISYVLFGFLLLVVPDGVVRRFGKEGRGWRMGKRHTHEHERDHHHHHHSEVKPRSKHIQRLHRTDLSAALMVLVWSVFVLSTPWLFWKGISYGSKQPGCDVSILFLVVPISIYNRGFVIALKVFAVIGVLFAVVCILLALVVLAVNSLHMLRKKRDIELPSPHYQQTKGKRSKKEKLAHFSWAIMLLVALGFTLAQVEGTIAVNHVRVESAYVGTTGQLLALVLTAAAVVVAGSVILGGRNKDEVEVVEVRRGHHGGSRIRSRSHGRSNESGVVLVRDGEP